MLGADGGREGERWVCVCRLGLWCGDFLSIFGFLSLLEGAAFLVCVLLVDRVMMQR